MITRYSQLEQDYRMWHTAPGAEDTAPLFNLKDIYPEDIYSSEGARYYGDFSGFDNESIAIIHAARGRPNYKVKIYRAVPKVLTPEEQIQRYVDEKKYILRYGKLPPKAEDKYMSASKYYEYISEKLENLRNQPPSAQSKKIQINPGDWVSISRGYAMQHGRSELKGDFRILTKTVPAKDLYTSGDSIHEWGYNPSSGGKK